MNGDSFVGRIAEGRPASLKRRLSALLPQFWTRDRAFRRSFEPCHLLRRTKALHPRPSSAPANNEVMVIAAQEVARIQVTNIKFKCRTFVQDTKQIRTAAKHPNDVRTIQEHQASPGPNILWNYFPTVRPWLPVRCGFMVPRRMCSYVTPSRSCNLTTSALFSGALNTSAGIPAAMSADRT
jgi:hypothetical protein